MKMWSIYIMCYGCLDSDPIVGWYQKHPKTESVLKSVEIPIPKRSMAVSVAVPTVKSEARGFRTSSEPRSTMEKTPTGGSHLPFVHDVLVRREILVPGNST